MTSPIEAVESASAGARIEKLARTTAARAGTGPQQIDAAAKSFEALFLTQFVQAMFSGVKTDGMFGGGHAEKLWRDVLAEKIADEASSRGGFGIADAVRKEIALSNKGPGAI